MCRESEQQASNYATLCEGCLALEDSISQKLEPLALAQEKLASFEHRLAFANERLSVVQGLHNANKLAQLQKMERSLHNGNAVAKLGQGPEGVAIKLCEFSAFTSTSNTELEVRTCYYKYAKGESKKCLSPYAETKEHLDRATTDKRGRKT